MTRRDRLALMADVLAAVPESGLTPTRIMYAVNASWTGLSPILARFVESGLLRAEPVHVGEKTVRMRYYVTEKGAKALQDYRRVKKVFNEQEAPKGT